KGLAKKGFDAGRATARDVMTEGIHCCGEEDDLTKAVRHMKDLKVRRLPVISKNKRMVGILTQGDVARSATHGALDRTFPISVVRVQAAAIMVELSVSGTWSGLPKEIASDLLAGAPLHRLKAGDTLFEAGDTGDGCYRLDNGLLKVALVSPQVREQI